MERGDEGRVRTDDIAAGGAPGERGPVEEGAAPDGGHASTGGEVRQGGAEAWPPQSPAEPGQGVGEAGGGVAVGGDERGVEQPAGGPGAAGGAGREPGGTGDVGSAGAAGDQVGQAPGDGGGAARAGGEDAPTPLLSDEDAGEFERRWHDLQVSFVDEPQRCVQDADALVAEVMQRLADGFAQERKNLESQWAGGGEASTEDLRLALQRYRSFFNRLLRTT